MKRNFLIKFKVLIVLLCTNSIVNAQNLMPVDYWTVGGNNPNTTARLGTINCKDVVITTENRELVNLACGGLIRFGGPTSNTDTNNVRVAIGSGNISARLEVTGFIDKTDHVIKANVLYKGNNHVSAIRASSNPATGYGYGLNADAGKIAVNALNSGKNYTGSTYGTYSSSDGSAGKRHGVFCTATGTGTAITYGLKGFAGSTGSGDQFGVYGETSMNGSGNKYAILGISNDSTSSSEYAGFFLGRVYTAVLIQGSDRKLKEQIKSSSGTLGQLCKLNPADYFFKKEYIESMNLPGIAQHGFIADEVEKIFPELVSENVQPALYSTDTGEKKSDEIHFKGINYNGFIPLIVQSVKEQQTIIEKYKAENEVLRSEMEDMKEKMARVEHLLYKCCSVEIKESEVFPSGLINFGKLEQNNPNPFSSTTEIRYSIPEKSNNPVINIYGNSLKPLMSYNITITLNGIVTIPAGTFASGEYIYELVIDGQPVDRKKMIITR